MRAPRSFVGSVLSTRKQRQRFYWARNMIAIVCGALAFHATGGGGIGIGLGVGALLLSYFTVAPVIAFLLCFFEQMNS